MLLSKRDKKMMPTDSGFTPDISLKEAAALAGVSPDTVRRWCFIHGIGRQLGKHTPWRVYPAPLLMARAGDRQALEAYQAGDRSSELVKPYIEGVGL
jgi:hypothetical protein